MLISLELHEPFHNYKNECLNLGITNKHWMQMGGHLILLAKPTRLRKYKGNDVLSELVNGNCIIDKQSIEEELSWMNNFHLFIVICLYSSKLIHA